MNSKIVFLFLFILIFSTSCFKKDEALPLHKFDGEAFVFRKSIYYSQFFYDLSSNTIIRENENGKWDLSFDASEKGWAIRINTSNLLAVWPAGLTDFETINFSTVNSKWLYDKSNGDIDSTAIGKWVYSDTYPYTYSNQIYLLGQYNGVTYNPLKKIVFTLVTDSSYQFKFSDINGENLHDVILKKDSSYNQIFFSFAKNDTVLIEPQKMDWDLLFTQYTTTLFTDKGIAIPYYVRGVLINSHNIMVKVDSVDSYTTILMGNLNLDNFKSDWDIIGYNWKSVDINQQANSADYFIRSKYTYLIKDTEGEYYKLKFISYYDFLQTPGYPGFIFNKL